MQKTEKMCRGETARRIAMLLCGAAILSFGLFNVHAQSRITEGGVLGMTLLVQHWLGVSPAITEAVLDIMCYLLGLRVLGKDFLKYALLATGGFACFYALWERIGPVVPNLGGMPIEAALVGGMFVGIGAGLVVRAGGASGGDDALALVLARLLRCDVSRAYLLTDAVVLLLSLSYIPLTNIAVSLLSVTLSSFIIGRIHSAGKKENTPAQSGGKTHSDAK